MKTVVTIPGGVQEVPGCGTQHSGLVDKVVIGQILDLMVFSSLNDSVIW